LVEEDEDESGQPPARLPDVLSGGGAAGGLVVLLCLHILFTLLAILVTLRSLETSSSWQHWERQDVMEFSICLGWLVVAAIALLFCRWLACASRNLLDMGVGGLHYFPAEAAVSPLVPLLNLAYPWLILQEMWRASHPQLPRDPDVWSVRPGSNLINAWGTCWLLTNLAVAGALVLEVAVWDDYEVELAVAWMAVRCLSILTALFAIAMVLALQKRQARKLRALHEGRP
jgi:hypothetical protein